MTAAYRAQAPSDAILSVFFGKERIATLLAQGSDTDAAMGIRFYFALNDKGQMTLVAAGATANQNDQTDPEKYVILDMGAPCPGAGCPSTKSPLQG